MSAQAQRRQGALIPAVAMIVVIASGSSAAQPSPDGPKGEVMMRFTARVEFGKDTGQNFGSLFEAPASSGRLTVGAGFPGLYNTRFRSDRYAVQFFLRPVDGEREFTTERLPRPNESAGVYLFDLDGKVYASGDAQDETVRWWNEAAQTWEADASSVPGRMRLGQGMLLFDGGRVEYDGRSILAEPEQGTYHRFYYAQGRLFFYHTYWAEESGYRAYEADATGYSKLYACPWLPESGEPADLRQAAVLTLPFVGETPFAYGQLGTDVLTCSNIGGLYLFDGKAWRTLVEPVLNRSYQIYSMINFYDRLLMGQYPTGLLYEFNGKDVTLLDGWPPRLEGVSPNAREAQTTAIYGGDLFVGVWPWGELWRYTPDADRWRAVGRMFTHPPLTDETTHPYENECIEHELVTNQWGQRVTSLVPLGDSLIVSTSAKWPCKWEPRFDFLGGDRWKEYGSVIRLRMPGSLSAPVSRTEGPTELEFLVESDAMRILQEGRQLASAPLGTTLAAEIAGAPQVGEVTWGRGVFGPFGGATLEGSVEPAEKKGR